MSKKGTEYELFVKEVYECLNKADDLTDVDIQHDVKIKGAAGVDHQIDVFWAFNKGGVNYRVAVECKDYKNHVCKEKIEAFHAVLHDIGNIHGIFVSKMGFQKGAIEYARKYGIQLMEIRHPVDKDWDGKMRDIHIVLSFMTIGDIKPQIFVNKERAVKQGVGLSEDGGFHAWTDEVTIQYNEMVVDKKIKKRNSQNTMQEIIQLLPVEEPYKGKKVMVTFEDAMLYSENMVLPIDAIEFTYNINEGKENIDIYGDDVIRVLVKNITEGSEKHIDKFGKVSTRENNYDFQG